MAHAACAFQSLIGRLKTCVTPLGSVAQPAFQSLIGRLKTASRWGASAGLSVFQSLIGRLKTRCGKERRFEDE